MSIPDAVLECVRILTSAQANKTLGLDLQHELADILVRLKIWAGNVGVFAPDNASLDYRLRDDPDLVEVLFSMISRLKQSLLKAISPPLLEETDDEDKEVEQGRGPDTISSGSSSASLSLDSSVESDSNNPLGKSDPSLTFIKESHEVIDRLYRLATVFRKPASSSENAKVQDFIKRLKEKGEVEELEDVQDHTWSHIKAHFPHAPEFLVDRLVEGVIFRRMKVRYRQRHQAKLKQGLEKLPAAKNDTEKPAAGPVVPSQSPAKRESGFSARGGDAPVQPMPPSVAFSATIASSVNRAKTVDYARSTALSGITSTAVRRRQQLDVPPPPNDDDQNKTECPYCLRMVGQEEMSEPRWTRHILKDIEPYVCLFEDCKEGLALFKTAEEWLGHLQWQHTIVYSCQAVGHEREVFGSSQSLEDHIRRDHPDTFTESQLPGLITQGTLPAPNTFRALNLSLSVVESQCAICQNFDSQVVEARNTDDASLSTDPEHRMQNHILGHLEAIALLGLPYRDDSDGIDSNARQSSLHPDAAKKGETYDLPTPIFEDIAAETPRDESVPDRDGQNDIWIPVFQQIKQQRLVDTHHDPVLIELREGQEREANLHPLLHFHRWVDSNQFVGTDGQGNDAQYIPRDALQQYWRGDRVIPIMKALSEVPAVYVHGDDLLRRYYRIFSILAHISTTQNAKLDYIKGFMELDIDDGLLPFKTKPDALPNSIDGIQTFRDFQEKQWLFSPVALGPNRLQSKELPPRSVLPFTVEEVLSCRIGGSTTVKKCTVHPSCGLSIGTIVLKEFESSEIEHSFKNEIESYIVLENKVSKEIYTEQFLKCYGSFRKGDKAFIMLEYSDQGSLLDFFNRNDVPRERHELYSLWESLSNLCIGLEHIHNLQQYHTNSDIGTIRCAHQDIKPAHIFVFRKGDSTEYRYQFKIGSFWMSSIALIRTMSKSIRSLDNVSTKMYGAPELTNPYPDLDTIDYGSLWKMDIWSMGCVLFEVLVWMTGGSRGVSAFFRMRQAETDSDPRHTSQGYSGCFHNGKSRIQAVDDMMELIMQRRMVFDDLSGPIGDLLLREMLIPRNKRRLEARTLHPRLEEILKAEKRPPEQLDTFEPQSLTRYKQDGSKAQTGMAEEDRGDVELPVSRLVGRRHSQKGAIDSRSSSEALRMHEDPKQNPNRASGYDRRLGGETLPSDHRLTEGNLSHISLGAASSSNIKGAMLYARVTISRVLKWIEEKKKGWAPEPLPDHERVMHEINGRKQIFVVDDSNTMRKHHWAQVIEAVQALGYLVKHADPDGVELFYTSRPMKPKKSGGKESTSLVRSLEEHGGKPLEGPCNMENSLGMILEHAKSGLTKGSVFRPQASRRGINIYILTDGIWEGGTEVQCGVEEPIKSLSRTMQAIGRNRTSVVLQFIQFGDDVLGQERLQYLDDELGKQLDFDIVDHTHSQRDGVWHMLVGSISRGMDSI